ncbi:hypothetical protein KIN20_012753 [Parelaphostrongylus tenuis]|uniref:SCP domain-containing protein n=1 Tax=Parelaphostrongylus tenuis TaxID=148309 RepID=A0AAD5QN06_PARTN|nr:hypothetical protein KIN20_012753 [Parelaphostrongylus tenuis]
MNSFLFALVLVAGCKLSHSEENSEEYGGDIGEKEQCDMNTNMTPDLRFSIRVEHNRLRIHLANGTHKNGNGSPAGNFPQASDRASCNIAVYSGNVSNLKSYINDLINRWWNTSIENPPLVSLTPTLNDTGMIPFLQMANANTTKVGCAYSVCDHTPQCPTRPPYVVFVCQYGESSVKVNAPIYKQGTPCSSCSSSCAGKYLCKRASPITMESSLDHFRD